VCLPKAIDPSRPPQDVCRHESHRHVSHHAEIFDARRIENLFEHSDTLEKPWPAERRAEARRPRRCVEARDQNVSRSPICPVLVDATLVIWPKVGEVTVVFGLLYCRQLNTLNDSMRN